MPGSCGLIGHIAGTIVQDGWSTWQKFAKDAISETEDYLAAIDAVVMPSVPVSIDFDVPYNLSTPFKKPDAPVVPDLEYESPDEVANIDLGTISIPVLDSLTVAPPDAPALSLPLAPSRLNKSAPNDVPTLSPIEIPDAPALADPDDPALRQIVLPNAPNFTLSKFEATAPDSSNIATPKDVFGFVEELYNSTLLDDVRSRVTTMLAGGTGLPDPIWQALWEKNTEREDENGKKAVREANEEFAARGFSLPPGALSARVSETRQQVLAAKNAASREIAVQQAQMEVENIRFAVGQALALEDTLITAHLQRQARALQAQQIAVDVSVQIFNARVTLFNAQVESFRAQADAYRTQLEGEMKELEKYRVELDGKRIESELNRQEVEIYTARLQALQTRVLVYRSQIEAATAVAETDKLRIEAFRTKVEAFGEEVRAKTAEFQGYGEQIRGELAKVEVFDSQVRAYGSRIEAWKSKNDGLIEQTKISYEAERLKLQKFAAQLDNYRSKVQAEVSRIEAQSRIYDAQTRVYSAELSAESARVESEDKQFALAVEKAKAESAHELKQAEVNIAQLQRIATLEQEQLTTIATVNSSLAAGAMAAVNLSAGVNEQASNSTSCSTSYSF